MPGKKTCPEKPKGLVAREVTRAEQLLRVPMGHDLVPGKRTCSVRTRGAGHKIVRMFVTFEGLDGSGKTTQVELLRRALEGEGHDVVATREPGGTEAGERIRNLLLGSTEVAPWTEAALFAAARAQLVEEVIAPALEAGRDVICDRYIDSSLAYQGIARGLGVDSILELNLRVTRGLLPDRTFLILVPPEDALQRSRPTDRIERESREFHTAVDAAYRTLAELFPNRIEALDGTRPPKEIAEEVRDRLRQLA